jgi:hypothetical protein
MQEILESVAAKELGVGVSLSSCMHKYSKISNTELGIDLIYSKANG